MRSSLHLFLYSLMLPIIWLGVGFTLSSFSSNVQLGVPGYLVLLLSTYWLIAFLFVKNFGRQLTLAEEVQLILCCSVWAVAIEASVIFSTFPEGELHQEKFLNTLAIVAAMQFVYNSLATHFACKKFINKGLEQVRENGT